MSRWHLQTRQFLLPKSGYLLSECEDVIGTNEATRRFAIADGATEAFDARHWAQLLAHNWVQIPSGALTTEEFRSWVAEESRVLHDSWRGLRLSWYAEEKAGTGSFAAFVGVQLDLDTANPSWRAIALGDSCLIHCRGEVLLSSLPISNHENFNSAPLLVPSHASLQEPTLHLAALGTGLINDGDVLLLVSDAAAAWYLKLVETGEPVRFSFDRLLRETQSGEETQNAELVRLFESERLAGRIKDDDIAVIRIEVVLATD